MIDSIINCKNIDLAQVVILSVGYDKTSSFRKGSDQGPQEIVKCLESKVELFEKNTRTEPSKLYKIANKKLININFLSPEKMIKKVSVVFKEIYQKGKFIITLGGSHSISIGIFEALASYKETSDITVLQIDAHMDLRNDDSDYNEKNPSRYAHSCVMRRACDFGFKIVQMGVRDYSKEEYDFVIKKNIPFFEWGFDKEPKIEKILSSIKTKKVYLTIDIDGLDPSITPATGTPVPGGISWSYIQNFLIYLFKNKNIIGADIVEVSPRRDDVITQYAAAELCHSLIANNFLFKT